MLSVRREVVHLMPWLYIRKGRMVCARHRHDDVYRFMSWGLTSVEVRRVSMDGASALRPPAAAQAEDNQHAETQDTVAPSDVHGQSASASLCRILQTSDNHRRLLSRDHGTPRPVYSHFVGHHGVGARVSETGVNCRPNYSRGWPDSIAIEYRDRSGWLARSTTSLPGAQHNSPGRGVYAIRSYQPGQLKGIVCLRMSSRH